jgi:UDP-N-acetylenolpyruvoylglucosamine reductase
LVNLGDATTADMLALMSLMREEVERTSNVCLEPEVRLLGADFPWESSFADPQESPDPDG